MDEVADRSVHLIITSPPYWQLKDYGHDSQLGFSDSYETYINHLNVVWNNCHRVLQPGYCGLSNASYGTDWPKIAYLKASLAELLEQNRVSEAAMFAVLENRRPQLPRPYAAPTAKMHATPFILGDQYGIRAATIIMVNRVGHCYFIERRYDAAGVLNGETRQSFTINPGGE